MNTIAFDTRIDTTGQPVVVVRIDGRELLEHVREFEARFAALEGHPDLAGSYSELLCRVACPPSRHFFGQASEPNYQWKDKVSLLECECGEPGCWPLLCKITADEELVTWSEFEQPARSVGGDGLHWDYSSFGPFEFSAREYATALSLLSG